MPDLINGFPINSEGEGDEGNQEPKAYSQEEVLQLIQSEADKRVTEALKKQQKKYEKELNKQKSLVGLDEEARGKAEQEQKIAELQEQLTQYQLAATKAEIAKVLSTRGLDANLVDFVVTSTDQEECLEKIETLDKLFKTMVKKEVDTRLKSDTPKSTLGLAGSVTKEQFRKMSIAEQSEIAKNNIELYKQLTQR